MSTEPTARPARIAIVEDNAADVYLLEKALHRTQVNYDLYHFADGEAALHFFLQEDGYCDAPRPDLLVLDLHVPRVNGIQLLRRLREHDILSQMSVIALTGANVPRDRAIMETLGVTSYVVKSFTLGGYLYIGQLIKEVLIATQPTKETKG